MAEEPATKHDTTEGGVIGAVGGAIVGGLAGGPIGAVIGAVVGGAASAAAVHQVDKHDHDYTGAEYANSADGAATVSATNYADTSTTPVVPVAPAYTAPVAAVATDYSGATTMRDNGDEIVVPIVEEELQVGKRVEQTGGARVHTEVTETPVSASVNLREEHVTVNRVAVDRPATDADFGAGAVDMSLTETREVPVVSKEARVVEEVVIGKTATEHTETINDTVRRTDVAVDEIDR